MYFVITTSDRRKLGYASQDATNEHFVKELVIAENSTVIIEILFDPKLHFEVTEMVVGFDGGTDRTKRPKITKYINRFIEWGRGREDTPDTNPIHYVDHHGHYHVRSISRHSIGTSRVMGFEIETREPGNFSVITMFMGGEIEGFLRLPFRVVTAPNVKVKCVMPAHKNCYVTFNSAA
jgi:hypothetical protein